jgi:ABC-2 type transport system ATP-binding protein
MDFAIRTDHLTKIFGDQLVAVNDLSFEVPRGAVFGLLGPNGAGKTTLFCLLLGLQRATAGRAAVFGNPCGPNSIAVRRLVGYLPTHPQLPGHLRPIEYLDLLGQICRLPREVRKPRLASLLRAVGLLGTTDQPIRTLSTGETTRLGIAASLIADPPLLLWDEPTAGLDPAGRRLTLDLIRQLGTNRTVVVSTHILSDIDQIADYVGVMHQGKMIFCGPMQDMRRRLRRDDFRLELDGDAAALERVAGQIAAQTGVQAVLSGKTLVVQVAAEHSRAAALVQVLQQVEAGGLSLSAVSSGLNETENAYLQLLQEDQSHGFRHIDLDAPRGLDAAGSDLPA